MSIPASPGDSHNPPTTATQGIIPIIDHDALMNHYMPYDPTVPLNYEFEDMSEFGGAADICGNGAQLCVQFDNGCGWCPHADPDVCEAQAILDECLRTAATQMAINLLVATAGYKLALIICWTTMLPPSPAFWGCVTVASALFAIAGLGIAASYAESVRSCYAMFNIAYYGARAAACPGGTPIEP